MEDRLIVLDRTIRLLGESVLGTPAEIVTELVRTSVAIRTDARVAKSASGQVALVTLENLLIRTGIGVQFDVPGAPSASQLLPRGLPDGLVDLAESIFSGCTEVGLRRKADIAIVIGDLPAPPATRGIWLRADGIRAGFSDQRGDFQPGDAVAALEPASMAAAECIRYALRRLRPRSSTAAVWLARIAEAMVPSHRFPAGPIDLGEFDVVSGGAITNASLWTFVAHGDVRGRMRVFDDGRYELTNLNRYLWLTRARAMAGELKVEHLASLGLDRLEIEAVPHRFTTADTAEARKIILVGADDIGVRHTAQDADPDWLGIGATSHDEARVTEHERGAGCARCAHPVTDEPDGAPIPTIAPVSFEAGYRLAVAKMARAAGSASVPVERYITYWPLRPGAYKAGPVPFDRRCPIHGVTHRAA